MSDTVLKVENLSKIYRLGEIGTGTISHDLNRWWANVRGKEDPFSKIGQVNDRTKKAESDFVYALQDINFEVKQGEVLGIIGKNGAGKSTLLKLISKITSPSTGSIKAKGRIASLLEVGTGMHPEMTARENIYLNGAILGMKKWEIKKKFDEIVDFAGIAMYIDTPIKRFSSGMSVRLGFAVAAFLEPEILIVDEVLAVGDAEFQKKAIGKMKEVSSEGGRTVLFVSHNMASIQSLCSSCLILDNGCVLDIGNTDKMIDLYLKSNLINNKSKLIKRQIKDNQIAIISDIRLYTKDEKKVDSILSGQELNIKIDLISNIINSRVLIEVGLDNSKGERLTYFSNNLIEQKISIKKGENAVILKIERFPFLPDTYLLSIKLTIDDKVADWIQQGFSFDVEAGDFYNTGKININSKGKFLVDYDFQ